MATLPHPTKKLILIALAASQGRTILSLAKGARVHKTTFYRVLNGEKRSAPVDAYIAKELGISKKAMRRISDNG